VFERYREIQERRAAGEGGFTLIELLVVIVILGILAAIVLFSLAGVSHSSKQAACNTDAKSVESAVAAYYAAVGSYPATVNALTLTATTPTGATVGPFLHTPPSTSNGYSITMDATPAGQVDVTIGTGTPISYDSEASGTGCNANALS